MADLVPIAAFFLLIFYWSIIAPLFLTTLHSMWDLIPRPGIEPLSSGIEAES